MPQYTDEDVRNAFKTVARESRADDRKTGTIASAEGRYPFVVLDGEGGGAVTAYRGIYEPIVGARVTVELIPGTNQYKIVGIADDALVSRDPHPYDFERQGTSLYYPLALEAINNAAYNLGSDLLMTVYNFQVVSSENEFIYTASQTLDFSDSVPASNSRWAIVYGDVSTGVLDIYNHPSTATPDGEWVEAVNGMMTDVPSAVPVLAVRLDAGMTSWGTAWTNIKRGYLYTNKYIVRIPAPVQPTAGTVITDAYYQTLQANGSNVLSREKASFNDGLNTVANVSDDGVDTTNVSFDVPEMTGATDSLDGTAGVVPAPVAGDEGKFLKGDGTWDDVPTPPSAFTDLSDTFADYTGKAGQVIRVNATEDGLESVGAGSGGAEVTDGTTSVVGASTIRFPAGTITDNGSGEAEYTPDTAVTDALDTRLDTAETNITTLQGDVVALDGRIDALEADTDVYYQTVEVNDTPLTQRGSINLKAGSNITLTPNDDGAGDTTEITITAAPSGGSIGGGTPQGYVSGCAVDVTTNGTDVTVNPGICRADDDTYTMVYTAVDTVDLSTTGVGALDTGTIAADTWYYIYRIAKSSDGTTSVLASASGSSPTLPSGYDKKRIIGHVKTNGSSVLFRQRSRAGNSTERYVMWMENVQAAPFQILNNYNLVTPDTWYDVDCSAVVAPGAREVQITIYLDTPSGAVGIAWREKGTESKWSAMGITNTNQYGANTATVPIDSSRVGQVLTSNNVTDDLNIFVTAYIADLLPTFVGSSGV